MTNPSTEWQQKLWVCPKFWADSQKIVLAPMIRRWWSEWSTQFCHCCLWVSFFEVKCMTKPILLMLALVLLELTEFLQGGEIFLCYSRNKLVDKISWATLTVWCLRSHIDEVLTTWVSSSVEMDLAHGWPISIWLYVCQINRFMNSVAPNFRVQCSVIKAFSGTQAQLWNF